MNRAGWRCEANFVLKYKGLFASRCVFERLFGHIEDANSEMGRVERQLWHGHVGLCNRLCASYKFAIQANCFRHPPVLYPHQ